MSHRKRIAGIAGALLWGMGLAAGAVIDAQAQAQKQAQKKVYCWNQNGRKVCSDALPAEAANNARTEISARSGLATGQVARALTGEERITALQAAMVARRQAEAQAIQQRRDLAMVESYMTEADLRRAYGERTSLLDETIKASQLGLTNQRLSLISLLHQAGDWELDNKPVPARLAASIVQQHDDLLRQQQILAAQQADRATLDAELADAVSRYRALMATKPGAPDPATQDPPPAG